MIIIGAGISGIMAEKAFLGSGFDIEMYDASKEPLKAHLAVMRLRDQESERYFGQLDRITVRKAVLWKNNLTENPTIQMNNEYSLKTRGMIDRRSLSSCGEVDRYLFREFPKSFICQYGQSLTGYKDKSFEIGNNLKQYDICISTIPMPSLLSVLGINAGIEFIYKPIYVSRMSINLDSRVYQTIYIPESQFLVYRITLDNNVIVTESLAGFPSAEEIDYLLQFFAIGSKNYDLNSGHKQVQKYGKIVDIDDAVRRSLLMMITDKFNIYSLGRFAIWKSIRVDDVIKDIEQIKRLMDISGIRREYENRLIKLY